MMLRTNSSDKGRTQRLTNDERESATWIAERSCTEAFRVTPYLAWRIKQARRIGLIARFHILSGSSSNPLLRNDERMLFQALRSWPILIPEELLVKRRRGGTSLWLRKSCLRSFSFA